MSQPPIPSSNSLSLEGSFALGDRLVDLGRRKVVLGAHEESLTSIEVKLLAYLAGRAGEVVSKADLYRDVWDYSASTVSRAAEKAIVRLRKKIEHSSEDPEHLVTVWGEGWCFRLDLGRDLARASGLQAPTNVPASTREVVERPEFVQVDALLRASQRLVTLTGPGGMGKTTTALALARAANRSEGYGGGVWWVDLVEANSTEELVGRMAGVLNLELHGTDSPAQLVELGRFLSGRPVSLLVLDNCEQAVDEVAGIVAACLEAAPRLQVLVTSRVRLGLSLERVLSLAPLDAEAATGLLLARVQAAGATLDPGDPALPGLVACLEGLPLAIEIAAGHVGMLGAAVLTQRLDERLIHLDVRQRDQQERHRSLEACLDVSWDLLDGDAQAVLALSSLFRASFSLEAAETILAPAVRDREIYEVLQDLVDHSLLSLLPSGDATRLHLLLATSSYASRRRRSWTAEAPGFAALEESVKGELCAWFGLRGAPVALAARVRAGHMAQIRVLREDLGNLCAAVEFGLATGRTTEAAGAYGVAIPIFFLSSHGIHKAIELGLRLQEGVTAEPELLVPVLLQVARGYCSLSMQAKARPLAGELLALVDQGHAPGLKVDGLILMATVEWGETPLAEEWLLAALDAAETEALPESKLVHILSDLASVRGRRARWTEADEALERGLEMARRIEDLRGLAGLLYQSGDLNRARGRLAMSLSNFEESLAIYQDFGHVGRISLLKQSTAGIYVLSGRRSEALALCQVVLDAEGSTTSRRTANRARITRASCLLVEGPVRFREIRALLHELVHDEAHEPSLWIRAPALLVMADLELAAGELDSAEKHLEAYIQIYDVLGSELSALGRATLGLVKARQGDLEQARRLLDQALLDWPESRAYDHAVILCRACEVRSLDGRHEAAAEALEEARRLMTSMKVGPESPLGWLVEVADQALRATTR